MRASFVEQWFGPASCEVLGNLYRSVKDLNGAVIEVGCWEGRSTCALANAAHPEVIHAVDTWEGSPGEISAVLASERDVFAQFTRNIGAFTYGNVQPHRMGWRDFFDGYPSRVKLIHIDATHEYQEVAENIEAVLPLMVPGGVICGDDAHHPPIVRAVLDTLGDAQVDASLWIWRAP